MATQATFDAWEACALAASLVACGCSGRATTERPLADASFDAAAAALAPSRPTLATLATLAPGTTSGRIALADGSAFYTTCSATGGSVMRVPTSGGTPVVFASGTGCPVGPALGGTSLYVGALDVDATGGDIVEIPLDGRPATRLAWTFDLPLGVAVDGASVYWTTIGGAVMKIARSGGEPGTLVAPRAEDDAGASGQAALTRPLVDVNDVYWGDANAGVIRRVAKGGGAPATVTTVESIGEFAIDATDVYVAVGYVLVRAPLSGGVATTVTTAGGAPVGAIAPDPTSVYFAGEGGLWTAPLTGGAPIMLVSNRGTVDAVAVDGASLYWTERADGAASSGDGGGLVMKLTPD